MAAADAPRVGIPPTLDAAGRLRPGRRTWYADAAVVAALAEVGAIPLLLPAPAAPAALLDAVDGLLVPGGDDFPPPRPYPPHVRFAPATAEQLAFDGALVRGALARALPVLGLCYGMQLLVRETGGRLLHDIPTDRPDAGAHQLPEPESRHGLRVAPGTVLARVLGPDPGPVNSRHHQGVEDPGTLLRACAWADDGLVEAVEAVDGRFVVGVQWHPEDLEGPHRTRLFAAFAAACRTRRGK